MRQAEAMRPCVLIPHYNHAGQIGPVLQALRALELPLLIVDDGSDAAQWAALQALVADQPRCELIRQLPNRGKGAAVLHGLECAAERGYSHAVQIDADGQHRCADIPRLLEVARHQPAALVCGAPEYDASVPAVRLHGRKISRFWASVETWSRDIEDALCGFRVYPVPAIRAIAKESQLGLGMEFDTEILVRAHWAGIALVFVPTAVTYPATGLSHFRLWRDNVRISAMHTRLLFGMLRRLPLLVRRALAPRAA
jgi:glycosyltransferase involved in cell wall biosynthesis